MTRHNTFKCVLALASLLVSGAGAGAQAPVQDASASVPSRITFGLRTGAAVAKLVSDQQGTTQGRMAPAAGIFAEAQYNRWLSLVLDVMYTEYGGIGANPSSVYGRDSVAGRKVEHMNVQSQAIEVPLQLKLRPSLSTPIVPYVSFGVSKAFFLGSVSDNFVRSDGNIVEVGVDIDPVVHQSDFGGIGAIGIEVRGTRLRWSVEVFSRFGLTDFNQSQVPGLSAYAANAAGVKVGIGR